MIELAKTETGQVNGQVIGNNSRTNATGQPDSRIVDGHAVFYSKLTALVLIKQTKLGPIASGDRLPFPGDFDDLVNLCCYYSMALGQGKYYHEGLYGPLPALGTDYRSLLYAVLVGDSEQEDPRMHGKNYLVICFFYHSAMEEAVNRSRKGLENALGNFFKSNSSMEAVEENWGVLKVMMQNYIYCNDICLKNGIREQEK